MGSNKALLWFKIKTKEFEMGGGRDGVRVIYEAANTTGWENVQKVQKRFDLLDFIHHYL